MQGEILPPLKTVLYLPRGVQMTVSWDDEAEFLAARDFMQKLTGGLLIPHGWGDLDFCYFETEEQYQAFLDYRDELRHRKQEHS